MARTRSSELSSKIRCSAPAPARTSRRPRDADATRELLLVTAEGVFTEVGFDGARVDEIAQRAGVNKRMIYVYFGDKEGLYADVLRRAFGRIVKHTLLPLEVTNDAQQRLASWIRGYFSFLAEHPELVRLVEWEVLADGSRSASVMREVAEQELLQLTGLLNAGIESGQFRSDLDPNQALMAIHSLCFGTLSRRQLWSSLWQLDLGCPVVVDSASNFLVQFVLRGIGAAHVQSK